MNEDFSLSKEQKFSVIGDNTNQNQFHIILETVRYISLNTILTMKYFLH